MMPIVPLLVQERKEENRRSSTQAAKNLIDAKSIKETHWLEEP